MNKKIPTINSIAKLFNKSSAEIINNTPNTTQSLLSYFRVNDNEKYEQKLKNMILNELDLSVEDLFEFATQKQFKKDNTHKTICLSQNQQEIIHAGIEYKIVIEKIDYNLCLCGCGEKVIGKLKYINNAHKNKVYRARKNKNK